MCFILPSEEGPALGSSISPNVRKEQGCTFRRLQKHDEFSGRCGSFQSLTRFPPDARETTSGWERGVRR
jgi:hypothetical protein